MKSNDKDEKLILFIADKDEILNIKSNDIFDIEVKIPTKV